MKTLSNMIRIRSRGDTPYQGKHDTSQVHKLETVLYHSFFALLYLSINFMETNQNLLCT